MYSHALRQGWTKNGPRVDFTQTILFNSAMPLTQGLIEDKLSVLSDFYFNDQVSQFQIQVNAFSSNGKYGYLEKTLTSSKLVYSQFEIPDTLVIGDKVNVPVKITNNLPESSTFELKIDRKYYYHLQFPKKEEPVNFEELAANELAFDKRKSIFENKMSKSHRQNSSMVKIM